VEQDADLRHLERTIELAAAARDHGNHPFGSLLADAEGNVVLAPPSGRSSATGWRSGRSPCRAARSSSEVAIRSRSAGR